METIELVNDGTGLGFGIVGGKTTGVIVKTIVPGGIADQVSSLKLCRKVIYPLKLTGLSLQTKSHTMHTI